MKETGQIRITTTGTQITPYHKRQNPYLERITSVYQAMPKRKFGKYSPVTGYLLESDKEEPSFVTHRHDPIFLQDQFPDYQIVTIPHTPYRMLQKPISIDSDVTPREVQYEMIQDVLVHQGESQWFIHLSQGLGKTLLSVFLIAHFNIRSIIMCYDTKVLRQWERTILEKTDVGSERLLSIDSSKLLYQIVIGDFPAWEYDIFMCTPGLLRSFGTRYGWHLLSPLMERMGIGFKIFDEAHRNIGNMIKINAVTSVAKTLYLSGDFAQSNKQKEQLYFRMFHQVPILRPENEIMNTLRFTQAIVIKYDSKPTELDRASVYSRRGFSYYDYMKYQITTDEWFQTLDLIMDQIITTNVDKRKILILVNMIEHVDLVFHHICEKHEATYVCGRFHSQVPEEERERCIREANLIVSTYQSFSVGIDIASIKYVISGSVCTKVDDNQASGRPRPMADGSDAFYFMMCDMGFPYVKDKLAERLNYLKSTKIKGIAVVDYR